MSPVLLEQHPLWKPKWITTMFVLGAALGLRIAGLIGGSEWVAINTTALLTYVGGSVIENKALANGK